MNTLSPTNAGQCAKEDRIWVVEDIIMGEILWTGFSLKEARKFRGSSSRVKAHLKIRTGYIEQYERRK